MKFSGFFSSRPYFDPSGDNPWKTPLHFSLGFHVLVLMAALIMPSLLKSPARPEFYTVNLVNVAEIGQQAPAKSAPAKRAEPAPPAPVPAAPPAPPPKPQIIEPSEPVIKKPVASITPTTPSPPAVPAAPAEVISLSPTKQKIKHETPKPEVNKEAIVQEKKRSEQEVQKTKEAATRAAHDAVAKLRESIHAAARASAPAAAGSAPATAPAGSAASGHEGPAGPAGPGPGLDEAMKSYYAAVYQRIMEHWFLPPLQNWETSLVAIMVIKVNNDGTLIKSYFEKKSSNIYFNQIVEKTLHDATPLPPFPKELQESSLEIGLRFTPTGLF